MVSILASVVGDEGARGGLMNIDRDGAMYLD